MSHRVIRVVAFVGGILLLPASGRSQKQDRVVQIDGMGVDVHVSTRVPPHLMMKLVEPLRECFENVESTSAAGAVVINLAFQIDSAGAPREVTASGSDGAAVGLADCARRRALRVRFDPPDGGSASAQQSFIFIPESPSEPLAATREKGADESPPRAKPSFAPGVPIFVPLEPVSTHPVARMARAVRARVEACTEAVPRYSGVARVELVAAPDGSARDLSLRATPPQPKLTGCVRQSLARAPLPQHAGEQSWQVRLDVAVDDQGVSIVR